MRYLLYTVLLIGFLYLIFNYIKKSNKETMALNESLNNNISFEGTIVKMQASSNHAFGVILLNRIKSNINEFDEKIHGGIYPYKIKGDTIELYCTVADRKLGDLVRVVSNDHLIYYNPQESREKGNLNIITDPYDISFVKDNTVFK